MGSRFTRRISLPILAGALVIATVTACGSSAKLVGADGADPASKDSAAKVSVTPKADDTDVAVSSELGIKVEKGKLSKVKLVDDDGKSIDGDMRPDDSAWVPAKPLKYGTKYKATVTAIDKKKIPATAENAFTTMDEPSNTMFASVWNDADYDYGQAMPLMIDFPSDYEVPEDKRKAVEERLFVETDPVQPGAWHWFNGHHLEYRAEDFWEPGTKINIRAGLEGLPLGGDLYGETDVNTSMKIDTTKKSVEVNDQDKQLVAKKDGETVKKMDVSLGKKGHPSYSGTMVVMEKEEKTVFDTTNEPGCDGKQKGEDCYKTKIKFAQRLTWSGQYIHSAPWSEGDQGVRNVSHGCVNVNESNAEWIFDFNKLGTPVTISGTGTDLPYGDGYTAYGMSWEDFLDGSHLPPPGDDKNGDKDKDDEKD